MFLNLPIIIFSNSFYFIYYFHFYSHLFSFIGQESSCIATITNYIIFTHLHCIIITMLYCVQNCYNHCLLNPNITEASLILLQLHDCSYYSKSRECTLLTAAEDVCTTQYRKNTLSSGSPLQQK